MCLLVAASYERLAFVWREQGLEGYADRLRLRADRLRQEVAQSGENPSTVNRIEDASN